MASRPATISTPPKPRPQPHANCETAKPKRVRIGRMQCVEVDGGKWIEMLRNAEFYTRGPKL